MFFSPATLIIATAPVSQPAPTSTPNGDPYQATIEHTSLAFAGVWVVPRGSID